MTKRTSGSMLSCCSPASKIPARPASIALSDQANIATRSGRPPLSSVSARSSTTARIATPMRVRNNKRRKTMATNMAQPNVISLCQLMLIPPIETVLPSKNFVNASRLESLGQIQLANPIMKANKATVTERRTTSDVPCSPRMTNRSVTMPNSGHKTNNVMKRANGAGRFQSKRNCQ